MGYEKKMWDVGYEASKNVGCGIWGPKKCGMWDIHTPVKKHILAIAAAIIQVENISMKK